MSGVDAGNRGIDGNDPVLDRSEFLTPEPCFRKAQCGKVIRGISWVEEKKAEDDYQDERRFPEEKE